MAETQSSNPDNLSNTIVFYEKANVVLRIALLVAVLWPMLAIGAALFLNPSNAQTIVPLVTLSPLVPMFLFILGAPFSFFLLWRNPDAKTGFLWLAALIAVELSISVYFTVIPIANDIGLVPLLILTASALFFLNVAKIAHWLVLLLSLVLIAITIIFIVGGRPKVKEFYVQVVDPPNTPTSTTIRTREPPAPIQQPSVTPPLAAPPPTPTPQATPPQPPQPTPFQPQWIKPNTRPSKIFSALRRNLAERAIDGVFSERGFSIDWAV